MDRPEPVDLSELLTFAGRTARDAGRVLLEARASGVRGRGVQRKAGTDIVTEADLRAERAILEAVRSAYPGDAVLAEESGATGESERRWAVDPLDGTVNFANGLPYFAVSIALEDAEGGLLGVVLSVEDDELFSAGRGLPARRNGTVMSEVGRAVRLSDAVVAMQLPAEMLSAPGVFEQWMRSCRGIRMTGSTAIDLAWTALGRYDLMLYRRTTARWDWAAGELLIERTEGCAVRVIGEFGGMEVVAAGSAHLVRELEPGFVLGG